MTPFWNGDLILDTGSALKDVALSISQRDSPSAIPGNAALRFLSIVETAQIPLYMAVGRSYNVTTTQHDTKRWFSTLLLSGSHDDTNENNPWWQTARLDSPLGILVAVDQAVPQTTRLRVTELLFFASRSPVCERPPTPPESPPSPEDAISHRNASTFQICALPLSSDLLCSGLDQIETPPISPLPNDSLEATFLPSVQPKPVNTEIINEPPVRKRKSLNDAFDEANERRNKARRKGGEAIAAAAAVPQTKTEDPLASMKHRRSVSITQVPLQTRPLSRSSSVASARPATREPSVPAVTKLSGLSQIQNVETASPEQVSLEQKNKEYVSKMVMAGMRLQGLVQSKTRKSRANSAAPSPAIDTSFEQVEADRKNDEEYKLVYHQVYKGTCFAFRQHISALSLQGHTIPLQETVEKLLAVFLTDPLAVAPRTELDETTPGGRKAFGSSALPVTETRNPFLQAATAEKDSRSNTPCMRKPKDPPP